MYLNTDITVHGYYTTQKSGPFFFFEFPKKKKDCPPILPSSWRFLNTLEVHWNLRYFKVIVFCFLFCLLPQSTRVKCHTPCLNAMSSPSSVFYRNQKSRIVLRKPSSKWKDWEIAHIFFRFPLVPQEQRIFTALDILSFVFS